HVADAAGDVRMRATLADLARGLDERHAVAVVLLDAGGDREDVGIEDDVFGREAYLLDEELVAALADRPLALDRVGLALLVERHDHHGRAICLHLAGMLEERILTLLETD